MSRRLGVALLGAGWAGRMHSAEYGRAAGLLADRGVRLEPVVVADADLDRARSVARRSAIPAVEADWRAAVHRDDVDLVDICLPDECHAEVAIAAARAGRHILCEKPLAQTVEQGEAALAEVERAGVTAMVGLQYRRTPAAELLGRLIDDGRLGRPHTVRAYFARDVGADPATRVGWRFDAARIGSGSVHALGPHVIDLLRYLVGEITAVAASVQSDVGTVRTGEGTVRSGDGTGARTTDSADVLLRFAGGAHGVLQTSWAAFGRKHHLEIEVLGEGGGARLVSDRLGQVELADSAATAPGYRTVYSGPDQRLGRLLDLTPGVAVGLDSAQAVQLYDLGLAIAEGRPVAPDFRDGLAVDRCLAAIEQSSAQRRWVELNADHPPLAIARST
ncbi:MAG: levoglucosan dehydrogenase [Pseudonocardiales bacterium]|nr:levoglucosan dehydrogenase [Pseudonocardiales bacterium]